MSFVPGLLLFVVATLVIAGLLGTFQTAGGHEGHGHGHGHDDHGHGHDHGHGGHGHGH